MERKLSRVYYGPKGFWKGLGVVKKLAEEARVFEDVTKLWLMRQAIWHIYLPAPKHILRSKFDVDFPNAVHQADLLFLPHDKLFRKVYKYALTVVDVASRFKAAEPLTSKESSEVSKAFQTIYKRGPLRWPKILQVDPRREFMGETTKEMTKHDVRITRGNVNVHRDQGIVERFDRTLEGGQRRATDPIWSLKVFNIEKALVNEKEPVLYYLKDGPKRGFFREELQIVPPKTELPPEGTR
ncbi:hypothetical protein AWC38_SpisGene22967 [Stylophora pistillata]|uniref:Integrase catalytic domain-containing protein n=1 Tax=Stylophora pistillata TaxID=50429 RepID=A0A2B4R840_STYPI|nr:hypothetical protein AWC38_SpisGene22967 [Stylophora pistillata]